MTGERWATLCTRLGAHGETAHVFQAVVAGYTEPHRQYHTLAHLRDCLEQFDSARALAAQADAVEAALWFHDAIYDTHSPENEERSAQWAERALVAAGVAVEVARYVADLVRVTRHDAQPSGADACLLVDVDLSILGRAPAVFDAYERQIRAEYAWVPEPMFRTGRAGILESLLRRDVIYTTPCFHNRYEAQARANLQRSLAALRG